MFFPSFRPSGASVAAAQGSYYIASGVWPLVHRRSFEAVTGRKSDWWLVVTVGSLVVSVGAALMAAQRYSHMQTETRILAMGSALSLAGVDLVYVAKRQIRPVYLADALAELALLAGWLRST
jgi:hypothetical protein